MSIPSNRLRLVCSVLALLAGANAASSAADLPIGSIKPFFSEYCYDCHDSDVQKGGLNLEALGTDLSDAATMAGWVRIHDRVENGEMPPKKKSQPEASTKESFLKQLATGLTGAHAREKGTVLRRLNRREYQNTLNDLFGTNEDLENSLPEDGRAHGFDTVGEALSISMAQMQGYLNAADQVMEAATAVWPEAPKVDYSKSSYSESREGKKFIGDKWKKLPDGATVFFKRLGYPTGMLRDASAKKAGFYKIKVTGYAHQSNEPVTFSVGSTTFARGLEKPTYGYYSFPPGKPSTIELTAWMGERYMIQIEPWGITDKDNALKNLGVNKYPGPGLAILSVELEGPLHEEYPTRGHKLLYDGLSRTVIEPGNPRDKTRSWYVPKWQVSSSDEIGDATTVFTRIATKAWRRPVTSADLKPYLSLFESERSKGSNLDEALRTGIAALLTAPDFLFMKEKPGRLNDYALATRLSYFLTRTSPDEELMALAGQGKLTGDSVTLMAQVDRLLADPRSERFVVDFLDGWLDLRSIEFTNPDRNLFPEFDAYLQWSMLKESRGFFSQLLKEDLSVSNFIDSDFAMLNNRLALHYGIDGVQGTDLQKIKLPSDSPRGGVMAQASVLKVSANGTATSPVIRGVWVLERIMGIVPPPPPPAVPGVEPDIRGAETIRQLLDKHRDMTSCKGCHQLIDPPGFALEQFNPIGGYRENFRSMGVGERINLQVDGRKVRYKKGLPVDASGELLDGRTFNGFDEFKNRLLEDQSGIAHCLTEKLLTFGTGRELGFSDRQGVEEIVKQLHENGDGLKTLIKQIVLSDIFQSK